MIFECAVGVFMFRHAAIFEKTFVIEIILEVRKWELVLIEMKLLSNPNALVSTQ